MTVVAVVLNDAPSSVPGRRCGWCGDGVSPTAAATVKFCCQRCRQSAWRARKRGLVAPGADDGPRRFAYADPPYPGFAGLYEDHPDFGGEVDHEALVASLMAAEYDGWALSTSSKTLRDVLPLCPPMARVVAWVKPIGVSGKTYGMHSAWEPVIVVGGRQTRPGFRDWLAAQPAKLGGSALVGRKPDAFAQFVFRCLGMQPGDVLDDLFPGSGAVGRSWRAVGGTSGDREWRDGRLRSVSDETASSSTSATTPVARIRTTPVVQVHGDGASLLQQRRLPNVEVKPGV